MPTVPQVFTPIETFMPSMDLRNSQATHVLAGENFYFDSKGPKSGFASDIFDPFAIGAPKGVQGIEIQGRYFVFTQDAILMRRLQTPFMWEVLVNFETALPDDSNTPWSGAFLDGEWFFAQKYRGVYKAVMNQFTERMMVRQQSDATITGLLEGIEAVAVVRNRLVLASKRYVQWSAVEDASDLTPTLGGAGFATIQNYAKGDFFSLMEYEDGFTVWTTGGSLKAEFIDGDAVWRFYPAISTERPISPWAIVQLTDNAHVLMSNHGLFISNAGRDPEAWTPEFNEFYLTYISELQREQQLWRLEYDQSRQMIYVMESNNDTTFWRSFVLTPTRNKWGVFSKEVFGILPLSAGRYGYVETDGVSWFFTSGLYQQVEPLNGMGANRHYPRLEKNLLIPSSSAVSRAITFDPSAPLDPADFPKADWYEPYAKTPGIRYVGNLESWIELGYIVPANLAESADALPEMHELMFGSEPSLPAFPPDWTIHGQEARMYWEDEDWGGDVVIGTQDIHEDYMTEDGAEDLLTAPGGADEDFLHLVILLMSPPDVSEDWMVAEGDEDWNGDFADLPIVFAGISVQASQDGKTFQEFLPSRVRYDVNQITFSILTSGTWHRIRVEATEPGQYYHIRYLAGTFEYGGQLI